MDGYCGHTCDTYDLHRYTHIYAFLCVKKRWSRATGPGPLSTDRRQGKVTSMPCLSCRAVCRSYMAKWEGHRQDTDTAYTSSMRKKKKCYPPLPSRGLHKKASAECERSSFFGGPFLLAAGTLACAVSSFLGTKLGHRTWEEMTKSALGIGSRVFHRKSDTVGEGRMNATTMTTDRDFGPGSRPFASRP